MQWHHLERRKSYWMSLSPPTSLCFLLDDPLLSFWALTTTTLTPPMPPWDSMASRNSWGVVTELPSSIKRLTWDLIWATSSLAAIQRPSHWAHNCKLVYLQEEYCGFGSDNHVNLALTGVGNHLYFFWYLFFLFAMLLWYIYGGVVCKCIFPGSITLKGDPVIFYYIS